MLDSGLFLSNIWEFLSGYYIFKTHTKNTVQHGSTFIFHWSTYTLKHLHTEALTHWSTYTLKHLHTEALTQWSTYTMKHLHNEALTQWSTYTMKHLHNEALTQNICIIVITNYLYGANSFVTSLRNNVFLTFTLSVRYVQVKNIGANKKNLYRICINCYSWFDYHWKQSTLDMYKCSTSVQTRHTH